MQQQAEDTNMSNVTGQESTVLPQLTNAEQTLPQEADLSTFPVSDQPPLVLLQVRYVSNLLWIVDEEQKHTECGTW